MGGVGSGKGPRITGPRQQNVDKKMAQAKHECSDEVQGAIKRLIASLRLNRESSLEQARDATIELAEAGDFDLMAKLIMGRLPYEHEKKEVISADGRQATLADIREMILQVESNAEPD